MSNRSFLYDTTLVEGVMNRKVIDVLYSALDSGDASMCATITSAFNDRSTLRWLLAKYCIFRYPNMHYIKYVITTCDPTPLLTVQKSDEHIQRMSEIPRSANEECLTNIDYCGNRVLHGFRNELLETFRQTYGDEDWWDIVNIVDRHFRHEDVIIAALCAHVEKYIDERIDITPTFDDESHELRLRFIDGDALLRGEVPTIPLDEKVDTVVEHSLLKLDLYGYPITTMVNDLRFIGFTFEHDSSNLATLTDVSILPTRFKMFQLLAFNTNVRRLRFMTHLLVGPYDEKAFNVLVKHNTLKRLFELCDMQLVRYNGKLFNLLRLNNRVKLTTDYDTYLQKGVNDRLIEVFTADRVTDLNAYRGLSKQLVRILLFRRAAGIDPYLYGIVRDGDKLIPAYDIFNTRRSNVMLNVRYPIHINEYRRIIDGCAKEVKNIVPTWIDIVSRCEQLRSTDRVEICSWLAKNVNTKCWNIAAYKLLFRS